MTVRRGATRGAIAAGDRRTVDAGLFALRQGGNAVDAALAAGLTASVVEPILTGLGGGGVALVRSGRDGILRAHDFFAATPGQAHDGRDVPAMTAAPVDYGMEIQTFHVGPAAVSVPGIPAGFEDLHRRYGTLPLTVLAEPALDLARNGFCVGGNLPVTANLIPEVLAQDPAVAALYLPGGEVVTDGVVLHRPDLAASIELFAREGAAPFYRGDVAKALLGFAGNDRGWLTEADLLAYRAEAREPIRCAYRASVVSMNPPPGAGGALLAYALGLLQRVTDSVERMTPDVLLLLARIMAAADARRDARFFVELDSPPFIDEMLGEASLAEAAASLGDAGAVAPVDRTMGSTTQISTADENGWLVSYTSSNGETCGWMLPGTGILLNNFLGEEDLQGPDGTGRDPGLRIRTMMTPTILQMPDGSFAALGSGGANRIRSAVMQGIVHLIDRGQTPHQAVFHPRIHFEEGTCRIELPGCDRGEDAFLERHLGPIVRYPDLHMYFGGLHVVCLHPDGSFDGAGDPRRSGHYGCL